MDEFDSFGTRGRPVMFRCSIGGKRSLPFETTSFVGRRTELTEVKGLLKNNRLVTITGTGGVGKTRLALRVATAVQRDFADGACLVELGELCDGELLPVLIAAAEGLQSGGRPVLEALAEHLASRQLLLVLDNCEHIVDDTARVAGHLIRSCPELRILVTGREALHIAGEAVLRVSSLSVPEAGPPLSLLAAPRYDAIRLFVERATAVVPEFALTEDNVATIADICRRLDGLPLLIELAAARLKVLSPRDISQRLADRFALLTSRSRSAPSRHRTVRWCIDWSYSLCSPAEQVVWARASVFAGSFELDAAETVCRCQSAGENPLDVLTGLVDKSVLLREETHSVVRFRLLETLRDYGREKLEKSGEHIDIRRRHRDWYRQLAENAESNWIGPTQLDRIARLDREQPNLREALEFCFGGGEPAVALSIAAALRMFWVARGQVDEARYWLGRALGAGAAEVTVERAKALHIASAAAELQGDIGAAAALAREADTLAEQTQEPLVHAYTYLTRGTRACFSGEPQLAYTALVAALERFEAQRDVLGQILALLSLGLAHELEGDSAAALRCHERALELIELHHDEVYRATALWATAVSAWHQGDRDRPMRLLRQAVRLTSRLQDPLMAATVLETLAWIVCAGGNARRAAVFMGAARALAQTIGSSSTALLPKLVTDHEDCETAARRALGSRAFEAAFREGSLMDLDAAASCALDEQPETSGPGPPSGLTGREREVARLVAEGLTNKAIAARLVISQRTAQGHVEHILTKLGFTSRAQIAAWVAEQAGRPGPGR